MKIKTYLGLKMKTKRKTRTKYGSCVYTGLPLGADMKQIYRNIYCVVSVNLILYMNVQKALQDRQVYKKELMGLKLKVGTPTAFIN